MGKTVPPDVGARRDALRVSRLGIGGNLFLAALKLFAGLASRSAALLSDAAHSAADVLSDGIVLLGLRLSRRPPDKKHPQGYGKYEFVAALLLSGILFATGLLLAAAAVGRLRRGDGADAAPPGLWAAGAGAASLALKEGLYRYTRRWAETLRSPALLAEAWHHRSDALASLGALAGVWGARRGLLWLDAAAGLGIGLLLLPVAAGIFAEAAGKLRQGGGEADEEGQSGAEQ